MTRKAFFGILPHLALALAACDGPAPASDGGVPPPDASVADAAVQEDAGAPVEAGTIDPTFGEGGFVQFTSTTVDLLVEREAGFAAVLGQTGFFFDREGVEDGMASLANVRVFHDLVSLSGGRWLALIELNFDSSVRLFRLDAAFGIDDTFAAPAEAFEDLESASSLALDGAGSIFVAGTLDDGTTTRVVVRKLSAEGVLDTAFGVGGTATATLDDVEARGPVRVLADGSIAALCTRGFTPCVVRFDAGGAPDASFGTGGGVVLDAFGPRYPRALVVDPEGRLVVLGMSNETIQLGRLAADGSLDGTFGEGGMAELRGIVRPSSSDYDEAVEARALAVAPDGSLLVVGSFELDEPDDGAPDDEDLIIARFTPNGALDPTFAGRGWTRLDVAAGVERTRTWTDRALVFDDRVFVAGEHLREGTWRGFVTSVAL